MNKPNPFSAMKNYFVAGCYQNPCGWLTAVISEIFVLLAMNETISIRTGQIFAILSLLLIRPVFVWFKEECKSFEELLSICFYGEKGKKVTVSMGWIKICYFGSFLLLFNIALEITKACYSELGVECASKFNSGFNLDPCFVLLFFLAIAVAVIGAYPIAYSEKISLWKVLTKKTEFKEFHFVEHWKRTGRLFDLTNQSRKIVCRKIVTLVQFGRNRRAPARRRHSITKRCGVKKSSDPDGDRDCNLPYRSLNQANQSQCCLAKYIGGQ